MRLMALFLALVATACTGSTTPEPVGSDDAGAPATVVVTCAEDGTTSLSTPRVRALSDGVHVEARNQTGERRTLGGLGLLAEPGESSLASSQWPGPTRVKCLDLREGSTGDPARLRIVDPDGYFLDDPAEDGGEPCDGLGEIGGWTADYAPGAFTDRDVSLERARTLIPTLLDGDVDAALGGVCADDVLRWDGYPQDGSGSVMLLRDGRVVGVFALAQVVDGDWDSTSGWVCSEAWRAT